MATNNRPSNPIYNTYCLPILETISASWAKVSGSKKTFWAAIGIFLLVSLVFALISELLDQASALNGLVSFIASIVNILIQVGLVYIGILRAKDAPITYKQMFRAFDVNIGWKIIAAHILQALILLIPGLIIAFACPAIMNTNSAGFVIGILLGAICALVIIYLGIRMTLTTAFVVDRELGPVDAIKNSFRITRENVWNLFCVFFLQSLITFVSILPLGIGLIWTLPLGLIMYGVIYKRLSVNL